jgi:hypothetical protein
MSGKSDLACREISQEEIERYKSQGWAKLERFIEPAAVEVLLNRGRNKMGMDGDSNPQRDLKLPFFNVEPGEGPQEPGLAPLFSSVGAAAKQLMARRVPVGVRCYGDVFAVKLPEKSETMHEGNKKTDFHQDFPSWSFDRTGGMSFWIALADIRPAAGTMSFLSGSHKRGPLANFRTHAGHDLTDIYPELLSEHVLSEPVSYRAGDATVHSDLCVHCAGSNTTRDPRWAYIISVTPADACWSGAPAEGYSTEGLKQFGPLDDVRFPIMST